MPAKKKASDSIETSVITPANTKTAKAKVQVIEVNEDTRIVTTAPTKAVKGKASKADETPTVVKAALGATKATPNKQVQGKPQIQAAKAPKTPKEKLPKPVTVTRVELAQELAKVVGEHMIITGQEADAIVSEIIHTMIDSLKTGDEIEIRGFGSFRVRQRNARTGRNPKTGAKVDVLAKRVVYFKMGKDLKDYLKEQPIKIEHLLPEDFKVYSKGGSVVNWPAPGFKEVVLPTVNQYMGNDGGYVAFYTRNKNKGVYSVGGGIYVVGQIRLKGSYIGRIFHPHGYVNQDISASNEFKEIGKKVFDVDCWAGGDTGGWFGM